MRTILTLSLIATLCVPAICQGVDRYVDGTGAGGAYMTITGAMLASAPGDRILVLPGTYPAFQFSRGVHVIGLGTDPSQVVVARIAYHVSIPALNYDTLISNLTVSSNNPLDVLSIHGNELAPGTLTIDGCVLQNGVYLRGGEQGFYALINNTSVTPPTGHGFTGEACYLGGPGNYVEVRNTRIQAWDADQALGVPAGVALRLAAGTTARVIGGEITGGDGAGSPAPFTSGGDAIVSIIPGTVSLDLTGGVQVTGGAASGAAPGGHGTAIHGSVKIESAFVSGGAGVPAGLTHAVAQPSSSSSVHLVMNPGFQYAQGGVSLSPGQSLSVVLGSGLGLGALGISLGVELPSGSNFVTLALSQMVVIPMSSWSATIPNVPGLSIPGLMVYIQGVTLDPVSGSVNISDTAAVRIDF